MIVCNTVAELKSVVQTAKNENKSIGFVPTMGALHDGHISLVDAAKLQADFVIASIFVNPTQFNNSADLAHYPRTLEADLTKLEAANIDVVFVPTVEEVYAADFKQFDLDLGSIKGVMEDALRPGHFKGVVNVVYRLFDIVQPDTAFFGLKDFQQVAVIKYMTNHFQLPIQIIACPTKREQNGLAMSSRNMRLSEAEKEDALIIAETLNYAQSLVADHTPSEVVSLAKTHFQKGKLKLEYIELVHPLTLQTLTNEWVFDATMCIAAFCGEVRLIDNMQIA